jgi:hypothetical protein
MRRFNVPVDEPGFVRVLQPGRGLPDVIARERHGQCAFLVYPHREVHAVQVFQREEGRIAEFI